MPATSYMYAVPYTWYKEHNVRRYGMHGTSHKFIANKVAEFENNKNISISISKQNDIFHKKIVLSFSDTNTDERLTTLSNNIETIKKYPYSIVLLDQLFYFNKLFKRLNLRDLL